MTLVGMPHVAGAEVDVMVEEITRGSKVIVFKKRRRKHSERKNGFRRDVTMLRVLDVRMPAEYKDHNHVVREIVNELVDRSSVQNIPVESKQAETNKHAKEPTPDTSESDEVEEVENAGLEDEPKDDEEKTDSANPSDEQKR
jgi:large subunit ribosomal protein L21